MLSLTLPPLLSGRQPGGGVGRGEKSRCFLPVLAGEQMGQRGPLHCSRHRLPWFKERKLPPLVKTEQGTHPPGFVLSQPERTRPQHHQRNPWTPWTPFRGGLGRGAWLSRPVGTATGRAAPELLSLGYGRVSSGKHFLLQKSHKPIVKKKHFRNELFSFRYFYNYFPAATRDRLL